MNVEAETIARALGAKRSGKGWRASCPAHDDRDSSLDIDIVALAAASAFGTARIFDEPRLPGEHKCA